MKKTILYAVLFLIVGFAGCTNQTKSDLPMEKAGKPANQPTTPMKNLISIIEIPVTDLPRAMAFYQSILGISIEPMEMDGVQMGVFPSGEATVNIVLAKGNDYKPTTDGAVLYLNAGNDLQPVLDKIAQKGGKILVPKTEISPEMGYFGMFIDTEGNKMGVHSAH